VTKELVDKRLKEDMARLTELFKELTEHVYGHHETETNLVKRMEELEGRVAKLEKRTTS